MAGGHILIVDDRGLDKALEIIARGLGSFHLYYTKVCLENRICKFLNLRLADETVASTVYYEVGKVVVIYYVAVDRRYRSRGFGKILVLSVEELYGDDYIYLASTNYDNSPALNMFKSICYTAFPIDRLYEEFGETIDNVVKLTCGYDDDVILIKNAEIDPFLEYLNSIEREVDRVWEKNCYKPWLRLRGR